MAVVAKENVLGIVNVDAGATGAGVHRLMATPKARVCDLERIARGSKERGAEAHGQPS